MARLAGVDIPNEKRIEIALTYIFGVGRTRAKETLEATGISPDIRVKDLTDEQLIALRDHLEGNYKIEGDLRREIDADIRRKIRLIAIRVFATAATCRFAVSAPRPMLAPARVRSVQLPERRRHNASA